MYGYTKDPIEKKELIKTGNAKIRIFFGAFLYKNIVISRKVIDKNQPPQIAIFPKKDDMPTSPDLTELISSYA